MTYKFGDIIICQFPFTDNSSSKKRPAVVISSDSYNQSKEDLIILAITSKVDKLLEHEELIEEWDDAGLFKPSAFKSSVFTIHKKRIHMRLGRIEQIDQTKLIKMVNTILKTSA
ncbi:MAG: type II toxin-antitoxin system PemK/MazF family toxin [Candidatus Melainabacteria bacterium]|nr:type II toxin-antitoxin system PemK/MazF family toxin [Candidatus Melainabacteria bacterium]